MSKTRIYTVTDSHASRLVRAVSQAQAVSHVARRTFACRVATQTDLEELLPAGVKVEEAGADQHNEELSK